MNERRGWDLNPRTALRRSSVFKTDPFGRSGTPPFAHRSAALGGLEALAKEEAEQRQIERPPAARVHAHLRVARPDAHADAALSEVEADTARDPL